MSPKWLILQLQCPVRDTALSIPMFSKLLFHEPIYKNQSWPTFLLSDILLSSFNYIPSNCNNHASKFSKLFHFTTTQIKYTVNHVWIPTHIVDVQSLMTYHCPSDVPLSYTEISPTTPNHFTALSGGRLKFVPHYNLLWLHSWFVSAPIVICLLSATEIMILILGRIYYSHWNWIQS